MFIGSYQPDIKKIHATHGKKRYGILEEYLGFNPCFGFRIISPEQVFVSSFLASAHHPTYFYVFELDEEDVFGLDIVLWNRFIAEHVPIEEKFKETSFVEEHLHEVGLMINSEIPAKYCEYLFDISKAKIIHQLPIRPLLTYGANELFGKDLNKNFGAMLIAGLANNASESFTKGVVNNDLFLSMNKEDYEREVELNGKEHFERTLLLPTLAILDSYETVSIKLQQVLDELPLVRKCFNSSNYKKALQYRECLITSQDPNDTTYFKFDEAYDFLVSFVTTTGLEKKFSSSGRNSPCPCGSGLKYKKCHGKYL